MCYNHIKYNDSSLTSATVTARCRSHSSIGDLSYNWNNEGYSGNDSYSSDKSFDGALTLQVKGNDGSKDFTISLEPVDFAW